MPSAALCGPLPARVPETSLRGHQPAADETGFHTAITPRLHFREQLF